MYLFRGLAKNENSRVGVETQFPVPRISPLLSVPAGGFCLKNPLNKSAKKMNPISSGIPKYYL
jgi:hypothetical protein